MRRMRRKCLMLFALIGIFSVGGWARAQSGPIAAGAGAGDLSCRPDEAPSTGRSRPDRIVVPTPCAACRFRVRRGRDCRGVGWMPERRAAFRSTSPRRCSWQESAPWISPRPRPWSARLWRFTFRPRLCGFPISTPGSTTSGMTAFSKTFSQVRTSARIARASSWAVALR